MNYLKNILKKREILTIFLSGFVFIIVFILSNNLIFFDKAINYSFLSTKNNLTKFSVSDKIVMVEIDNKTLNKI